jgi:hypothetical protein
LDCPRVEHKPIHSADKILRGFWFKQRPFKRCGTTVNINEYLINRPGNSPLTNDVREVRTKRGCPCPSRRRGEIVIGILAEACCNFVSVGRIEGFDISPYDMLDTLSSAEFIRHGVAPTLLVRLRGFLREIGGADSNTNPADPLTAARVPVSLLPEVRTAQPGGPLVSCL